MEENKSNKKLIGLIITIVILVLGIIGYVVYENFLKEDKTIPDNGSSVTSSKSTSTTTATTSTTTTTKDNNEANYYKSSGEKCTKTDEKCVLTIMENISIKSDINNNIYINDNKIEDSFLEEILEFGFSITKLSDSYLLFIFNDHDSNPYMFNIYDEKGKKVSDLNDYTSLPIFNAEYNNGKLTTISRIYMPDYEPCECSRYKGSEIATIKEELTYSGEGKFSNRQVIEQKTLDEILKQKYEMSCDEIKVTNKEGFEYLKSCANGM